MATLCPLDVGKIPSKIKCPDVVRMDNIIKLSKHCEYIYSLKETKKKKKKSNRRWGNQKVSCSIRQPSSDSPLPFPCSIRISAK